MGTYYSSAEWWRLKRVSNVSISKARTRCWCLTISLAKTSIAEVSTTLETLAKEDSTFAACFSEEEGSEKDEATGQGYRHLQMAVYWSQPQTGGKVMKLFNKPFKAHVEPAISQEALCEYVQKQPTHISGPYKFGNWTEFEDQCKQAKENKGKRNDLISLENAITAGMTFTEIMSDPHLNKYVAGKKDWVKDRIAAFQFQNWATKNRSPLGNGLLSVDYIWGGTGKGKTHLINEMFGYSDKVFRIGTAEQYQSRFAFNQYEGQSVLLLDEYRSSFPFQTLLDVLYGTPYPFENKGGAGWGGWLKVFICAPGPVTQQYTSGENKLTEQDGSITQLYRRLSCGRVIELKEEYGKAKLPYASPEDCIEGKWDDSYPSKSIEEATMIDWRTNRSLYLSENRQLLEEERAAEIIVDDDDDEDW